MMRHKILLIEDDPDWHTIFSRLIGEADQFELTCTAGSMAEAARAIRRQHFDAALVDLGLPDGSGHDILRLIMRHRPRMRAAVCTVFEDPGNVIEAIRAGASGYIVKAHLHLGLVELLQQMLDGGAPLSPRIAHYILDVIRQEALPAPGTSLPEFTRREDDVLHAIANGMTLKQAAGILGIAESTVRTHVKSIYSKLGVGSRASAVLEASRRRLL